MVQCQSLKFWPIKSFVLNCDFKQYCWYILVNKMLFLTLEKFRHATTAFVFLGKKCHHFSLKTQKRHLRNQKISDAADLPFQKSRISHVKSVMFPSYAYSYSKMTWFEKPKASFCLGITVGMVLKLTWI